MPTFLIVVAYIGNIRQPNESSLKYKGREVLNCSANLNEPAVVACLSGCDILKVLPLLSGDRFRYLLIPRCSQGVFH